MKLNEVKKVVKEKAQKVMHNPGFWIGVGCAATVAMVKVIDKVLISDEFEGCAFIPEDLSYVGLEKTQLSKLTGKPLKFTTNKMGWSVENYQSVIDAMTKTLEEAKELGIK